MRIEWRHRGIGRRLCQAVMERDRTMDMRKAYLFTPDRVAFYRYMGWSPIETALFRGEEVTIMKKVL